MAKKESKKKSQERATKSSGLERSSAKKSVPDYNEKFRVDMSFDELMKVLATGEIKKEK